MLHIFPITLLIPSFGLTKPKAQLVLVENRAL